MFKDFVSFVREQGVVGLAVGFVLGGATREVVSAFVNDIINPVAGMLLGRADTLAEKTWRIGQIEILWGDFVKVMIDFLIIALVVYYTVKLARITQLDKKKR